MVAPTNAHCRASSDICLDHVAPAELCCSAGRRPIVALVAPLGCRAYECRTVDARLEILGIEKESGVIRMLAVGRGTREETPEQRVAALGHVREAECVAAAALVPVVAREILGVVAVLDPILRSQDWIEIVAVLGFELRLMRGIGEHVA